MPVRSSCPAEPAQNFVRERVSHSLLQVNVLERLDRLSVQIVFEKSVSNADIRSG